MEFDWSNPSCKRMEAKSKQEDYQSKLAIDMHNFHHGRGNGFNAHGGNGHGNGNFTPKRYNGVGIEYNGKIIEKELGAILEELPINLSLQPSLMCYEISLVEIELFSESYFSHVSVYGNLCAISYGGLFLFVPYASIYLSSHAFIEDSLLHSGSMLDPSYHDFRVLNNSSIESIVVGFELDGALFDILQDKCLGKFGENVGYVSSFLDTFIENHNDFVSLNQLMSFVSSQVEFSCNEHKLSNVTNSLNTLFETHLVPNL
ncbi:hypothetical protein M9H77_18179 [Catharanthus roseus]|uniref:Uncharacterized protein n=1 Tax=Catharanthus roseus TaxID=4058 RepID=A0ACC0B6P6_CATRO|nr:hypothetical protein M9H77_18179 [Catharanthus roseus]